MHSHYLNNSIEDSEELLEFTNRNNLKKQMITQKYNSGRFQYSSQEGNPNYSSLSNMDFHEEKSSTRQRNRTSTGGYPQSRKQKSKTSKGYYRPAPDKQDNKATSKSKKRKASKRNRSKNHDNAYTPISRTKFSKIKNANDFSNEVDNLSKKKRRKTHGDAPKHQKNASDNSVIYNSQNGGNNIRDKDLKKGQKQQVNGTAAYSPYMTSNGNMKKNSQRSKSTNPHISNNHQKLNCFEGFVNIDLSRLPHDMTQREVVETMIRKHELSNFMYSDEDKDTSRYIAQNLEDRRTCRRSQYNKNNDILITGNKSSSKEKITDKNSKEKLNTIPIRIDTIETENNDSRVSETPKDCIITEANVTQMLTKMEEDLAFLKSCDKSKENQSIKAQEEKKFFVYCRMFDEISDNFPKLKQLMQSIKEGLQSSIRSIVANEIKEKGMRENSMILQERENLTKIKQKYVDYQLKIDQQEDLINSKEDIITDIRSENESLKKMLENHRINGMKLQDENDRLTLEIERIRKVEEDLIEKYEGLESTDGDLALALKEIREQEKIDQQAKFEKYAKDVPRLDMEKVQEIIRLKCEAD